MQINQAQRTEQVNEVQTLPTKPTKVTNKHKCEAKHYWNDNANSRNKQTKTMHLQRLVFRRRTAANSAAHASNAHRDAVAVTADNSTAIG
jgi:hypothetical protein